MKKICIISLRLHISIGRKHPVPKDVWINLQGAGNWPGGRVLVIRGVAASGGSPGGRGQLRGLLFVQSGPWAPSRVDSVPI